MKTLENYPEKVLERLQYLEMRLAFLGEVKRRHIAVRFGVKSATCTRDISLYCEINPEAIDYDLHGKCYRPSRQFKFIFEHNIDDVFTYMATGQLPVKVEDRGFASHAPIYKLPGSTPDVNSCIAITQGLYANKGVEISYVSRTSGETRREIYPHCLFEFNSSWYVRAYDMANNEFRTFNLSRIKRSKKTSTNNKGHFKAADDTPFNTDIEVLITPHPKAKYKEAIETEFNMINGVLKVKLREGMFGYLMQKWRVDCSDNKSLNPDQFPLAIKYPERYHSIESHSIAPM